MTPIFVLVGLGLVWANLVGLGLLATRLTKDYAVGRVGGAIILCLLFFFLEHFCGLGPRLWFFPVSTAISAWMIWCGRAVLRREWGVEAAFGIGLLYCAIWRYAYPGIDVIGEKTTWPARGFPRPTGGCRPTTSISTIASNTTRPRSSAAGSRWSPGSATISPTAWSRV
jgi:hypothetical protein